MTDAADPGNGVALPVEEALGSKRRIVRVIRRREASLPPRV